MIMINSVCPGLLSSSCWYDPPFHLDIRISNPDEDVDHDEVRIETPEGSCLAIEFASDSGLLSGIVFLTFFDRAEQSNYFELCSTTDAEEGCPRLNIEHGLRKVYSRPNASRNVYMADGEFNIRVTPTSAIQFVFGEAPTKLIKISKDITAGIDDKSQLTLLEVSNIPTEAVKAILIGRQEE